MRGPKPLHQPSFTSAQLEEARQTVRRHRAAYVECQRARLLLLLAATPTMSHRAAAEQLGWSIPAVRKWRKRWATGPVRLADAPRPGRPRAFPPTGGRRRQGHRL